MLERFGIGERRRRALVVVAGIMTVMMAVVAEGPIGVRLVVGVIFGTVSAVGYVLMAVVLETIRG